MNSTDQQIVTGAIELLSNKGLEQRVQVLENVVLRLVWMLRDVSNFIDETNDSLEDLDPTFHPNSSPEQIKLCLERAEKLFNHPV
jgi:hypothetical protein